MIPEYKVILFFLFPALFSCNVSVKKGAQFEKYYEDGKIESRVFLIDGKKNGKATLFYHNGKVKEEGNWINDKQEGLWQFYFENGNISAKINFKDDNQDGLSTFYFPEGTLAQEVEFTKGHPYGISKTYYRYINKLKQQSIWINGKRNGELIIFDSLGNGFKKYIYKDDQVVQE